MGGEGRKGQKRGGGACRCVSPAIGRGHGNLVHGKKRRGPTGNDKVNLLPRGEKGRPAAISEKKIQKGAKRRDAGSRL